MPKSKKDETKPQDERSPEETELIREATLKRLLNTPPKPFTPSVKSKRKRKIEPKDDQ